MEVVGEEEEGVERDRARAKLRGVTFVDHSLGGQSLNPREWGGIREAEVVGKQEDEVLVVRLVLEKSGAFFGLVAEVVVVSGLKVAE